MPAVRIVDPVAVSVIVAALVVTIEPRWFIYFLLLLSGYLTGGQRLFFHRFTLTAPTILVPVASFFTVTLTVFLTTLLALALTIFSTPSASAGDRPAAPQPQTQTISAVDAYFRLMPPGKTVSAAFMQLKNTGSSAATLVALRSPSVERVELHEHSHANGMMQMRKVDKLSIAAGETLELKPGGYHIMLFGMPQGLTEEDRIDIELVFESGESLFIIASARSLK